MRRLVLCVALGGCGFKSTLAPDGGGTPGTDGTDGSAMTDGGVDCFAQWRSGPLKLSTPQKLASLTSAGDDRDPWISPDQLTLYFTSNRNGIHEIFRATRTSPVLPFGPPVRLVNLTVNQKDQERAALTGDEKTLMLASNRAGAKFQIFVTLRPDTMTDFGSPNQDHLATVNASNADSLDPFLSSDGRTLYFTQNVGGPAHPRIMIATRLDADSDFGTPVELGGINLSGRDTADPALALDDRAIVFSSNREGGKGNLDLWYATRADAFHEFSSPAPIAMVNTGEDDADPMLSSDGCELYFASNFEEDYNLYVSEVAHYTGTP
jgi:Tol biopolymer transport system component